MSVSSTSVASSVKVTGVSSSASADTSSATGASLTGSTVIATVAVPDTDGPSLAVQLNSSPPLKSSAGVYTHVSPAREHSSVPFAGSATMLYSRSSPSASVASSVTVTGLSSSVVTALSLVIGASFTASTVMVKTPALVTSPSLTS